jgi:cell division transport system permease protein
MKGVSIRRKAITLFRIANTGLHNLLRNAWLTTAAIAVMTVTVTIVASATLANYALQEAIEVASRDLTISVFLKDEGSEQVRTQLESDLESNEFVDSVFFKSKAEALSDFQEANADNQRLLDGLALSDGNPLPASLEVFMNDINEYQAVLDIANQSQYSDVVRETNDNETSRDAFNGFITAQDRINGASLILGAVFGSISVLVIFNTIRMAIFTRSDEIEIMKLIGATPNYIRGPYLFEAMMYGFIASIISLSVVYALALPFAKRFLEQEVTVSGIKFDGPFPDGVVTFFTEQWLIVFLFTIGAGMLLGFISSSVAMAKYLRLKKW